MPTTRKPIRRVAPRARGASRPLRVREVMSREVVSLSPDVSLREAIEMLANRHISGAPVVAGGKVAGVVSASDILAFEAATPAVPVGRAGEPEQGELETSEEWEEGAEAPSAFFTEMWEDAGADVGERMQELEGPEWDLLADHTVGEAMSAGVRSVEAGALLSDAAAYMLDQGIHRALVLERGELVGIITATDFMRAVAQHRC